MIKSFPGRMATFLTCCALLVCGFASLAKAQPYPKESYQLSDDGKKLLRWKGTETIIDMTQDPILNKVEVIGSLGYKGAFDENAYATKIVLPQALKNVESDALSWCKKLKEVDASHCMQLETLYAGKNRQLSVVKLPKTSTLTELNLTQCELLKPFDVTSFTNLKELTFYANQFTAPIDLTKNVNLETLYIENYAGTEPFDLSQNSKLISLDLRSFANLKSIDVSRLTELKTISVMGCSKIESLDLSKNLKLTGHNGKLQSAFRDCPALKELKLPITLVELGNNACKNSPALSPLDLTQYTNLTKVGGEAFKGIKTVKFPPSVNTCPDLGCDTVYWSSKAPIAPETYWTSKIKFKTFYVPAGMAQAYKDAGWSKYVEHIIELPAATYTVTLETQGEGTAQITGAADLSKVKEGTKLQVVATPKDENWKVKSILVNDTELLPETEFTVTANTKVKVVFAYEQFAYPKSSYELSEDGKTLIAWTGPETVINMTKDTTLNKVEKIFSSDKEGAFLKNENITELVLPEALKECNAKAIYDCSELIKVDASHCTQLQTLVMGECGYLENVELPQSTTLHTLDIFTCPEIVALDVTSLPNLKVLKFASSVIEEPIDLSKNKNLEEFAIDGYGGTELYDLSQHTKLKKVVFEWCENIKEFDGAPLTNLQSVRFAQCNNLERVDLSKNTNITGENGALVGAFDECVKLKEVKLPTSLKELGENAFLLCKNIKVMDLTQYSHLTTLGPKAFANIKTVKLPASVNTFPPLGCDTLYWYNKAPGKPLEHKGKKPSFETLYIPYGRTQIYKDAGWGECADHIIEMEPERFAVTLTKQGEGTLVIKKDGKELSAEELKAVNQGSVLTVEATPATGYKLTALTIDGKAVNSGDTFTLQANTAVSATFALQTFEVTVSHTGEGTLVIKKDGKALNAEALKAIEYGTKLTVEATPATGYKLTALTVDGKAVNSGDTFTIKANTAVSATFALQTFEVTVSHTGEGTLVIKKDGKALNAEALKAIEYGTKLTVEATPATGYKLTALTIDGKAVNSGDTFTLQANTTVSATFALQTFEVTVSHTGEGTLVIKKDGKALNAEALKAVEFGTQLTVEATPATGYKLTALTIDGKAVNSGDTFTLQANTAVAATFTKETANEAIEDNGVSAKRLQADRITLELPEPAHYELFTITGERKLAAYNSGRVEIPVEPTTRYILRVTMQNGNIRIFKL